MANYWVNMEYAMRHSFKITSGLALAVILSATASAASIEQIEQQYQQDLQFCESGAVTDIAACKKEAGAAAQAAKKGDLTETVGQGTAQNRCQHFTGERKTECELLMQGDNVQTRGSVQSGGVIRSLEIEYTPEPDTQAPDSNATDDLADGVQAKTYSVE